MPKVPHQGSDRIYRIQRWERMKSYKLTTWPDLPSSFRRVSYTRLLTELSQRSVTEEQLQRSTGIGIADIRSLLQHLEDEGHVDIQDLGNTVKRGWFSVTLNSWLRRA